MYLNGCSNLNTKEKLLKPYTCWKPEGDISGALESAINEFKKYRKNSVNKIWEDWFHSVHNNKTLYNLQKNLEEKDPFLFYSNETNFRIEDKILIYINQGLIKTGGIGKYCLNGKEKKGISIKYISNNKLVIQPYEVEENIILKKKTFFYNTKDKMINPNLFLYIEDKHQETDSKSLDNKKKEKKGKIFYLVRLNNKKYNLYSSWNEPKEYFVWQFINIRDTEERYEILYSKNYYNSIKDSLNNY